MMESFGLTLVGFLAIFIDLIFLPGGLLVAGGSVTILYSIYLTYQSYGIIWAAIHFLLCLAVAPKIINWSLDRVALKKELKNEDGYVASPDLSHLIGEKGHAVGDLRPSGKIKLHKLDELMECQSTGGYLDDGTHLIIIDAQAGRLTVRKNEN